MRIQKYINEFGKKRGLTVNREMITNGYLLSPKAVSELNALGEWRQIQVTLDGEAETHDNRRILVTGKGAWRKIVSNCRNALDHGLPLVIRMNVDARTPLNFKKIIDQLIGEGIVPRAGVYLGHVASGTPENQHIEDLSLEREQFADAKLNLSAHLLKQGLSSGISLPQAHCTLCTADSDNGWVIAPTGLIYKCWEEIAMGPDSAVGHLLEKQTIQQMVNAESWGGYDPTKKSGCSTCTALPVCMGGCPLHARKIKGEIGDCSDFRFRSKEIIQMAHAELAIGKHLENESSP